MLSKEVSSTTFWVFALTRPEIEPRSPEPSANTLPLSQWAGINAEYWHKRIGTISWERWCTGNCAKGWNLSMLTNGICTKQNLLKNVTHKFLRDFEIQTDFLIPARRPDIVLIKKKKITCHLVDCVFPADNRVKIKETGQPLEPCWEA